MPTYPDNDAVTTLVAAALFAPSPTDLLAQAATLARSSTHRQLVAIASAHVAGDADRVRVLASRPCLRSSRRRPRRLDGCGGHPDHRNHKGPVMNHSTTKRRFGVIGLAVALLSIGRLQHRRLEPAATHGRSARRRMRRDLDIGHATRRHRQRQRPRQPKRCLGPPRLSTNSSRSAMDVCTSDASAPAKRPSC